MIPIWAGVTVVIASFGYYMFAGDAIDTYPGKAKGMAQEAEGTVKGMMNQAEGKVGQPLFSFLNPWSSGVS